MSSKSHILAEIRAWFTRWRKVCPSKYDSESWDRLVNELRGIIPAGEEKEYSHIFNQYMALLEGMNE